MFKGLRIRLSLTFLLLSLLVYLILSVTSVMSFYYGLTQTIDEELLDIYALILPMIRVDEKGVPLLQGPPQLLSVRSMTVLPAVAVFDLNGVLIQRHRQGSPALLKHGQEDKVDSLNLRTLVKVLPNKNNKNRPCGYLQIQLNTAAREHAISDFLETVVLTAPVLIVLLTGAGYFFAGRAIKPVEDAFSTLRRFMSDAGHELKTPIAVIHATCDNLSADLENNASALERVSVISRSADRMQRLVADLLLLTKAERASLTLKMLPLRFDMLLREVLGEFSDLFDEKDIELSADTINNAKVSGDKDSLHRMLANLLENALNYTEPGGKVTVSLVVSGNLLVLKVQDSGVGIPPESLEKVFERFYRVDESRSRAKGGSGLGLAIVKAITESHHGQIQLASELGKGTTFTITLPVVGQSAIMSLMKTTQQGNA